MDDESRRLIAKAARDHAKYEELGLVCLILTLDIMLLFTTHNPFALTVAVARCLLVAFVPARSNTVVSLAALWVQL